MTSSAIIGFARYVEICEKILLIFLAHEMLSFHVVKSAALSAGL